MCDKSRFSLYDKTLIYDIRLLFLLLLLLQSSDFNAAKANLGYASIRNFTKPEIKIVNFVVFRGICCCCIEFKQEDIQTLVFVSFFLHNL